VRDEPDAAAAAGGLTSRRLAQLPSPDLPLVHLAGAHVSLALVFGVLAARPDVPGAFFYHPRALALVHLVTLGWISGSILGALYVVVPLVLGVPMRASRLDAWACVSFWAGTCGIVAGFWTGRFELVGGAAWLVLMPLALLGARVGRALRAARLPRGVSLHMVLAFLNVIGAGLFGVVLAINRWRGGLAASPLSLATAHAHLALLGWAAMMILGVGYRLIPMFAPARMPAGAGVGLSAVLLEAGTVGLAVALAADRSAMPWTILVAAAFATFVAQIGWALRAARPRPVDLPRPDWATWQSYASLACLVTAIGLGLRVAAGGAPGPTVWVYGTIGLLGFVAQMVAGIAGRLMPMHAWYRALERRDGVLPSRSVHQLIEPRLARAVFVLWLGGLPLLTLGLAGERPPVIAAGALLLLAATAASAGHGVVIVRRAERARGPGSRDRSMC
jgi:hypothetical protein